MTAGLVDELGGIGLKPVTNLPGEGEPVQHDLGFLLCRRAGVATST